MATTYTVTTGTHTCGHKHKTVKAAERCLHRLLGYTRNHGHPSGTLCGQCSGGVASRHNCSATWYNAKIVDQDGAVADRYERA